MYFDAVAQDLSLSAVTEVESHVLLAVQAFHLLVIR
jgi:hypothetical protein